MLTAVPSLSCLDSEKVAVCQASTVFFSLCLTCHLASGHPEEAIIIFIPILELKK